jgi:hypothetical protein
MLGVTLFGLFLTPVFYVVIRKLAHRFSDVRLAQHRSGVVEVHHE